MNEFDHESYLSPLTWRYGSDVMRQVWSEVTKRRLLRRFWVALADAQQEAGLVTAAQVADLRRQQDNVDIERATQIEKEIRHDLMAEIKCYAEQCPIGGGIIHWGATSMDALDNVDALRLQQALDLIIGRLESTLIKFAHRIETLAETPAIAFTHIQPAEPTTVGYRLAQYAQDLLGDWEELRRVRANIRGKGLKGAVGTSASYAQILAGTGWGVQQLEDRVMGKLGLAAFPVTTQTYPRKQDWWVLNALAGLGASLHKFAFDIRLLQSPPIGEWSEPFGERQVGSSAMPFKRNPIIAENMNSLTRWVAALPRVAWDNAALSLLERTLDDSANRRLLLPEAFLVMDEALQRAEKLIAGLEIRTVPTKRNLQNYGLFAATEPVLMTAVKSGADRQLLHELIREHSLTAWGALERGEPNPLADLLADDERLTRWISVDTVQEMLLSGAAHVGDAAERAMSLSAKVREAIGS